MKKVLFSMLLIVSMVGIVKAQETTGAKADQVKKEIIKLEEEKLAILRKNNVQDSVDYYKRTEVDNPTFVREDGRSFTKAQHADNTRAANAKFVSVTQEDPQIHVYLDGQVAIINYKQIETFANKVDTHEDTDFWVKIGGVWRRAGHVVVLYKPRD